MAARRATQGRMNQPRRRVIRHKAYKGPKEIEREIARLGRRMIRLIDELLRRVPEHERKKYRPVDGMFLL